jgi:hypothetical protein
MNQWAFVIAAYSLTLAATVGLVGWAIMSMRSAERSAEALKRR